MPDILLNNQCLTLLPPFGKNKLYNVSGVMIVFDYRIRITMQAFVIHMKAVFKKLPERLVIVLYTPRVIQSYQLNRGALYKMNDT